MENLIEITSNDIEEITKTLFMSAVKNSSNTIFCNEKLYELISTEPIYVTSKSDETNESFGMIGNVNLFLDKNIENDIPKFYHIKNKLL